MNSIDFPRTQEELLLPFAVERAVRALCDDYDRRAAELRRGKLSPTVLGHYMMLNAAIDEAIRAVCEEQMCETMRREIGNGIGPRNTQLYYIDPGTYKKRKRYCKFAIAKNLHLL